MLAQLRSSYVGGLAQLRPAYADAVATIPSITAESAHVVNFGTGQVYYTKDVLGERYLASLTKLTTAYVLLQHYPTEADLLSVSVTITSADLTAGGTGANLQAGDVLTLHALLVNAMLPSSNNSCLAIARVIGQKIIDDGGGGSDAVTRFVAEMNTVCTTLGMSDTSFANPHGATTDNTSSVVDVLKVAKPLWEDYAVFRAVDSLKSYQLPLIRSGSSTWFTIYTTNPLKDYPGVLGGKTGTLSAYTRNLMVYFESPTGELIGAAVMGSTGDATRASDMEAVLGALLTDYPELSEPVGFNADAVAGAAASGDLSTGINLAGDAAASAQASGALATEIGIEAAALVSATATGSLSTAINLAGSAASATLADGTLTTQIRLAGDAIAAAVADAGLSTQIMLDADAQAGADASGELTTVPSGLAGDAVAGATASGALSVQIILAGDALAAVLASGDLTTLGAGAELAGDATVLAIASGGLTTAIQMTGAPVISVTASGELSIGLGMTADALATVSASAVLSTQIRMEGAAVASALAAGSLTVEVLGGLMPEDFRGRFPARRSNVQSTRRVNMQTSRRGN